MIDIIFILCPLYLCSIAVLLVSDIFYMELVLVLYC